MKRRAVSATAELLVKIE